MVQPELKNDLSKEIQRAKTPRSCRLMTQFEVINAIYDSKLFSKIKLTAGARLVLISLARHYNPLRQDSFPSYSCIAAHTGVSKKSVERAIKELTEKGLVVYTTEKVNHYRFTDYFFSVVKMSEDYRQNDGSNCRQNVAQTNKPEKIKKKEKKGFLKIFCGLLRCGEEQKTENPRIRIAPEEIQNAQAEQKEIESETQQETEVNGAPAKKNCVEPLKPAPNTENGEVGENVQCAKQAESHAAYVEYERYSQSGSYKEYLKSECGAGHSAGSTDTAASTCAGGCGMQYGNYSNYGRGNENYGNYDAAYRRKTGSAGHSDGGGSRVPSAEATQKYLSELRYARQFACSPLEFEEEHARRWYNSLNPLLKTSVMAKKVAEKYNL